MPVLPVAFAQHLFHNVDYMAQPTKPLGEFEQVVLFTLLRLEDRAYGASIRREIELRTARRISISPVYTTLERLEAKGYVESRLGDPTPQRGGRRKKFFHLTTEGARALKSAYSDFRLLVQGLEDQLETI